MLWHRLFWHQLHEAEMYLTYQVEQVEVELRHTVTWL